MYNKYKEKIQYFIYNIVKDYQKAEDITQDTFVYVMQNKIKEGYTFKYYIYLVAKSRAYNYINTEKKRTEINETYILHEFNSIEQDVADIVTKNEKQKEIINAINMLEDRYKNTIYLTQIEKLTYKETAQILGESVQNVRNLIHRGKKELRKILIKKGFDEMNKVSKVIIAILCISILLAGGVYATAKIVESFSGKAKITPTFTSKISSIDTNKVWCGTFNLVWNDFINDVIGEKIEFEDLKEFKAIAGFGVEAIMKNDDKYLIGNRKLMTENGVIIPNEQDEQQLVNDGNSILFVSLNNKLVALIGVKDILKDNIENVIKELKDKNINVVMLTGDNEKTAEIVAKQIGIEKVIPNVTPKEKAEKIKELKKDGIVIMCGDGINDSISLVTADIGVSISSGTDIAMDSASVILMNDNIEKINELIEISEKTIKNIKQNLFWAFFYNICMIPIACGVLIPFGISMNPMIAAFAMTVSSLTVVLNALRLRM